MQIKLLALLTLCLTFVACAPEQKCSGDLVYDENMVLCHPCPKDSTFKDGTCICKAGYDYVNFQCKLKADAMVDMEEDAGAPPDSGTATGGATCEDYCTFSNSCLGMNSLAGALGSLVSDLDADDPAACKSTCENALGSAQSSSAALSCFAENKANAMCKDPMPQMGLRAAFGVIEQCCGTRPSDGLCKSICGVLKPNPIVGSMVMFCP